jgi:sterol desaturase/sphingolipid hydroxylase (fatty acid hydroxylase superfamily)
MDWIVAIGQGRLTTLAWMAGLALVFGVLARLMPCNPGMYWWKNARAAITDLLYWLVVPIFLRYCYIIMVLIGVVVFFDGRQPRFLPVGHLSLAVQCVLVFVLQDVMLYWLHRGFHGRLGWRFHSVHHSPTVLDWMSSSRWHPVNFVLEFTLVDVIVILLGFTPDTLVVLAPLNTVYSAMVHANLNWTFGPFKYLLASPVFHRWHHTAQDEGRDKNFAPTLPLLDVMFGTFYMPAGIRPTNFGDHDFPAGFWGQFVHPLTGQEPKSIPTRSSSKPAPRRQAA